MTNEIREAKDGLIARLENIPGLRAIGFEPDDWRDFPVAIIRLDGRSGAVEAGGARTVEGEFVVRIMAANARKRDAHDLLDGYMARSGAMSVEAALDGDRTLGGAVEDARLVRVENAGTAELGGGRYAAADFRVRFVKRMAAFRRMAEVTAPTAAIVNEDSGANRNYADYTNIGGVRPAAARMKIRGTGWSGSGRMWVARRSGARRTDKLFFQGESGVATKGDSIFTDGAGIWSGGARTSSKASGGSYARMMWTRAGNYTTRSEFTLCGYTRIRIAGGDIPRGRFRALARVAADTNNEKMRVGRLGFALGWSFAGMSGTPTEDRVALPDVAGAFQTLDLGEIEIPSRALPEGYESPDMYLDIYGALVGGGAGGSGGTHHFRWSVDCLMLLPVDEGAVSVDGVGAGERLMMDTLSASGAGVYVLDGADKILRLGGFTGAPFGLGPEDTRIYVVRDDAGAPSGVGFSVEQTYAPVVGVG